MRIVLTALAALILSASASALEYAGEHNQFSFTPAVAVSTGKVDFDSSAEREYWTSFSGIADFDYLPLELEFRYSLADSKERWLDTTAEAKWNTYGVGAKLDLSWRCQAACLYLMAGYNFSQLNGKVSAGGSTVTDTVNMHYPHVGLGFRYQFTEDLRAMIEWQQFNIGYQKYRDEEFDLGHARAWQAGMAYFF
ncbi:outer membrane beta-barrel protein [Microbulbifer bruguierae]|uniref:Outer membrane beta-barrel protein n=1 Tax=Microbulbifer bruguierae TaxID=3029061 RepID=A0ABY8NAF1_9GAMM|nr:outer membrane beta-barrel protein [Microbulbifer bruguierae]WGL15876.1 outer membrane beta-barrel protein [Microbulbifer bruguierae]